MDEKLDNPILEEGQAAPRLWGWHTYLSMAVTLAILWWLISLVDLAQVWKEVAASNKGYILMATFCHYLTYPVRGLRWRRCLKHLPIRGSGAKFGLVVFFYNFIDNVVPAKLGDVYASHLARINFGIRRSAAIGSIVFLRMLDAWIVLGLAVLSSWLLFSTHLPRSVFWVLIGGCIIAGAASLILVTFFILKRSLPAWIPEKVKQIIQAFQTGMWPKPAEYFSIGFYTAVIWVLEMLWIYNLARGFGLKPGGMEAVFLTMLPLLASAFPFTPAGAGVVEVTLFNCLRVVGVAEPLAVSLTVVNRFIDYWLHIMLGIFVWTVRRRIGLQSWREVLPVSRSIEVGEKKQSRKHEIF